MLAHRFTHILIMILTVSKTGIIPKLVRELSSHASLAQKTADAAAAYSALAHLSICRQHYQSMTSLAFEGKLANAVREVHALEDALVASPTPLRQSGIFGQLQVRKRF
jgi:protein transport protein DSL1/ZW10